MTSLSFTDNMTLSTAKISIITASILSAIFGAVVFKIIDTKSKKPVVTKKQVQRVE